MSKKLILILTLLACYNYAHAGEVYYKWKDDRGRIHYSAIPPLQGEYEGFTKHGIPTKDLRAEKEALQASSQNRPREQAAASPPHEKAQSETVATAEAKKSLQQNCAKAKTNLALLQSGQDVIRVDSEGNKIVLGEPEREEALRQAHKDLEYFCEP